MKKKKITFNRMIGLFILGGSLYFTAGIQNTHAQNKDYSTVEISNQKLPVFKPLTSFGSFNYNVSSLNISPSFFKSHFLEWLGMDSDHSFELVKEYQDDLGFTHSVFQHFYKNVKVQDELLLLHEKNNIVTSINGQLTSKINVSNLTSVSKDVVKNAVENFFNSENEIFLSEEEQVIIPLLKSGNLNHYNVSKITGVDFSKLKAFVFYVDSKGEIINKLSKRYDADTPSTSATYYKGNQQITVDSYNGSYRLKDNNRNIHTLNGTNMSIDQFTGAISGATEYTSATANFTTNATKPAVEVHWGMKVAYDFYKNRHNRNSYDDNGTIIKNYYNVDFSNYIDGAPSNFGFNAAALDMHPSIPAIMIYGNGNHPMNPGLGNPFVSIDVAGHEYSHLIIGRNGLGGLNYQGESGAINESIADMFGAAIEFYSGATPNWTIGEGVLNFNMPYLRSLSNPNSGPEALQGQQPDTYQGTYWASTAANAEDFGGVHTNSGVGNYWFYLLSAGGSGRNDINNNFNVSGIGIEKAEKIVYRALTTYLTPNSTYLDFYHATRSAISDLYGAGAEWNSNINAWYAVGIGDGVLSNENSFELDKNLAVYPNPVTEGVLNISSDIDGDGTYEIYDITGKLVIKETVLYRGNNTVNVDGIHKGVYLLKIHSGNTSTTKKIVVQ